MTLERSAFPSQSNWRILHVTTAHQADDVRIFERECQSLAASGKYEVYLAAPGAMPRGGETTQIPLAPAPGHRLRRFVAGPRKANALSRMVSADLWHFHDPELLPVALKLALSGEQVIWDAHEDYVGQLTGSDAKSWVPKPARSAVRAGTQALLSLIDKYAAGIIAATPAIASRYSNQRTAVVGNEARLELFENCRPTFASQQVLFTGSPGPGHLFSDVVKAIAGLPNVRLAVAGRQPDPTVWAEATATLGDRLKHLGWLDRAGLVGAIGSSALGLATYSDIPVHATNSPNKLFEFAAAGLPVVATPTQSNMRYVSENGIGGVADGFSSEDLARTINRLLTDEPAWGAASQAGRVWAAREGSWSASEARLLSLYDDVLSIRKTP